MIDAITIIIKQCCDDLPNAPIYKMLGGNGMLRRTKGHLGCKPPEDEATSRLRGTVYSSK